MANEDRGNCPNCRRALIGAVEIITTESDGIPTIRFEETSDRNWIQCDACNLIICKSCCDNPTSGCCNGCLKQIEKTKLNKTPTQFQNQPIG